MLRIAAELVAVRAHPAEVWEWILGVQSLADLGSQRGKAALFFAHGTVGCLVRLAAIERFFAACLFEPMMGIRRLLRLRGHGGTEDRKRRQCLVPCATTGTAIWLVPAQRS